MLELDELQARVKHINAAPRERGPVHKLCVRPMEGERLFPARLDFSVEEGIVGDRWQHHTWMHLPDGSADPRLQVCILQKRVLDLVWLDRQNTPYTADNMIVDMNLSEHNLPVGSRLQAGSAILQVSDVFNTGCSKWRARYGEPSLRWINLEENRPLRLRGVLCQVLQAGSIGIEDALEKR